MTALVTSSGFEAGGLNVPSIIEPWYKIGTAAQITIGTECSSPHARNPVALKIEVLCDNNDASLQCPKGGVGVANPGFWGMVRFYSDSHLSSNSSLESMIQMVDVMRVF